MTVGIHRQVQDAIPIPGLLGSLGPAVQTVRSTPLPLPLPLPLPSSSQLLQQAASLLPPVLGADEFGQLSKAALALDQLASVANEVRLLGGELLVRGLLVGPLAAAVVTALDINVENCHSSILGGPVQLPLPLR